MEKESQEVASQLLVTKRSLHLLRGEHEELKSQPQIKQEAQPAAEVAIVNEQPNDTKEEESAAMRHLEAELVGSKAESEARLQAISELNKELEACKAALKQLQMVHTEVSDQEVQQHPQFVNMNMELQQTKRELQVAREDKDRLFWEKDTLEATHSLQLEQTKSKSMLEQQKVNMQYDTIRQHNSRLNAEVDALKRRLETKDVVPDLAPQIQEQKLLISTLQAQLERSTKETVRQKGLLEVADKQVKAAESQNKDEMVAQLNVKLEMKEKEVEEYIEEINEVATEYEQLTTQNVRLLDQLKSKEDAKTTLIEEKIQAKRIESMLRAQKEELQRKATAITEEKTAEKVVQEKLVEQLKHAESKAANLLQSEQVMNKLVETHKQFAKDAMVLYNGSRATLEANKKELEDWKNHSRADSDVLKEKRLEAQKLSEQVKSLTKKLAYYTDKSGGIKRSGAERELEDLRQLLSCKIDPSKMLGLNTFCVITKCFHCFSEAGLSKRIANRDRKCPACGQRFDQADVKTIYTDF